MNVVRTRMPFGDWCFRPERVAEGPENSSWRPRCQAESPVDGAAHAAVRLAQPDIRLGCVVALHCFVFDKAVRTWYTCFAVVAGEV